MEYTTVVQQKNVKSWLEWSKINALLEFVGIKEFLLESSGHGYNDKGNYFGGMDTELSIDVRSFQMKSCYDLQEELSSW